MTHRLMTRNEAAEYLGVNPQTITNWVDGGILKGKMIKDGRCVKELRIDRNSIDALLDDLKDVEDRRIKLEEQKQEIQALNRELEKEVAELQTCLGIVRNPVLGQANRRTLNGLLLLLCEDYFTGRELEVVRQMMTDNDIDYIARKFDITKQRVAQIALKAAGRLRYVESIPRLRNEIKALEGKLAEADKVINERDGYIAYLESQVDTKVLEVEKRPILDKRLADCDLSVRAINCCRNADIFTVGQLTLRRKVDMYKIRNMVQKSVRELNDFLVSNGLHFKP